MERPSELEIRIDPKRLAENYLRAVGVNYNDLITGDHAAQLFADFNRRMVDYCNELSRAYNEKLKYEFGPIQFTPLRGFDDRP